jgi:hypothetical protein
MFSGVSQSRFIQDTYDICPASQITSVQLYHESATLEHPECSPKYPNAGKVHNNNIASTVTARSTIKAFSPSTVQTRKLGTSFNYTTHSDAITLILPRD